jgi:hypothetical protein
LCKAELCGFSGELFSSPQQAMIDGEKDPRRTGAPVTTIAQAGACRTGFPSLRRSPVMIAEPV